MADTETKAPAFTPGPWRVVVEASRATEPAIMAGDYYVATAHDVDADGVYATTKANAAMCAAAPDLYAACERVYISLLALPLSERISRQRELSACRDALAAASDRSDQEVQDYYTARAWEGRS